MNSATVFYNDAQYLAGAACFDVRFGTQILPSGSVVAGFITEAGETHDVPYMQNAAQVASYEAALAEARQYVPATVAGVRALEAEIARLRAALAPLATCNVPPRGFGYGTVIDDVAIKVVLRAEDIQRARALLTAP